MLLYPTSPFARFLKFSKGFSSGFIEVCQLPVCTSQALSVGYTNVSLGHCMMHFSSPVSLVTLVLPAVSMYTSAL
jgi:hypothetical protein